MLLKSSKINEFRLWGLLLTMGGMLIMIIGLAGVVFDWGAAGRIIAVIFLILGMISMLGSMAIYFWAGMMSTSAVALDCPECGKRTKMIGKTDRCMFCKTILTVDPSMAPAEAESVDEDNIRKAETGSASSAIDSSKS
ncbi:YgzB family protein [Paenibacillus sp. UNC499MF]|uniref:YgzB family protein n=1 Tax=Paenibacillus sp. UNC499MF TaxID=1502751 RepID=UPI00089F9A8C|nr:YgzB family protein [Paenibacillus sp. UNC499MF]SEG78173.1 Zinc-ribbon containing domain-containing protein [Paenibacillus sp. UNC499MF]